MYFMSTSLFKCDQIGWITLRVIKNDKNPRVIDIVYNRIKQNMGLLCLFRRWCPHSSISHRVFPGEDFTQVHSPVPLGVWPRVRIFGRVVSIYSKRHPFSIYSGCKRKKIFTIFRNDINRKNGSGHI